MIVFIGMECSGEIRRAYEAKGHTAYSCDLKPAEDGSPMHIQGDVFEVIGSIRPDLAILHPVCTYLCSSGLHWNHRRPERAKLTEAGIQDFMRCVNVDVPQICIENPIGCMSRIYRKPDQIIQPWQFGEDASKATCIWLKGLPPLIPTAIVAPRWVNGRKRWANQTDSGQNRLAPSEHRATDRARTYPGIAKAMADQWRD